MKVFLGKNDKKNKRKEGDKIMNFTEQKLTGKASIDKPWLNFYPEQFRNLEIPRITIEAFLKMKNPNEDKIAFEYYGNKITWKQLWEDVDVAARALKALGLNEGDRVPSFLYLRQLILFCFLQQKESV